ncbi:MAG: hypothetical protein RL220_665 [Bacteroidota bacterium]
MTRESSEARKVELSILSLGKRFNREWIFNEVNAVISSGEQAAIIGSNGSGKSTLLQCILGSMSSSVGSVELSIDGSQIPREKQFTYFSIAAPYASLYEDFTLRESITFHSKFKHFLPGIGENEIAGLTGLSRHLDKKIRHFSSGMRQRVKLSLAVLSDVPIVCLDEPCSHLDEEGEKWYGTFVQQYMGNRLMLVASNHLDTETFFCKKQIRVSDYKRSDVRSAADHSQSSQG